MLLHFSNHINFRSIDGLVVRLNPDRVVDRRQLPSLKLNVNDRSDDLNHPAILLRHRRCFHHVPLFLYCASAPETTSMISRVMAACRTLFM